MFIDDTLNDIVNTFSGDSCLTSPEEFSSTVEQIAKESPIFGGIVAPKRHPEQGGVVQRGFLQQAIIFSCRGTLKHFNNINDADKYVTKMRELNYRSVPFGKDRAFQISLYDNKLIASREKTAQLWGLGVCCMKHESATKRPFAEMDNDTKQSLKEMIFYL